MRFERAVAELDARQPEHMPEPDLERISALAELLDDPQLRERMGRVGRERVKTALAWEHEAPRLLAAYEKLFN